MKNNKIFLEYNPTSKRNISETFLTLLSGFFSIISVLPLILVITFVLIKGGAEISWGTLILEPEPPGDDLLSAGGVGPAIIGTFIITIISSLIAIPIGIGGGIYLAAVSYTHLRAHET